MSPRAALAAMLEGTGVEIVDTGAGAATLRPPKAAPAIAESGAAQVQTVMVTARKTSERMLDVPIAITAITGEDLKRRGAVSVADVLQDAPGVSVVDNGGITVIAIRGISTSLGANENGYYLDDLPFTGVTVPISPDVRAWDIDRIEILRGPQGTLFGEGSMGGTVRILTNNARLREFSYAGQAGGSQTQGGSGNSSEKVMVNVPLGETFAVRIGATHEDFSGWIDDPATGRHDVNDSHIDTQRVRVRFDPTDRLTINGSYWSYDARLGPGNSATDAGTLPQSGAPITGEQYAVSGLNATYDFDDVSLFYGYSRNTFSLPENGALFGGTLNASIDIGVTSQELRLASSGSGPLKWTGGLYHRDSDRSDTFAFPLFSLNNISNTESAADAVFGEASYMLSAVPIELTAGVRRFRDRLRSQDFNSGVPTPPADFTFDSTDPHVSVSWRPSRDLQVYTSASKGFRSGQIQPSASVALAGPLGIGLNPALKPDSIWTYELGTKAALLDHRMTVEAAIYHSDWKDETVRIPLGTTGFNGLINSAGTTTDGIEAQVTLDVTQALDVSLGASFSDARYAGDVPGTGIHKGSRVDGVPSTALSASLQYRFAAFGNWQGAARAGAQYNSKRESPSFPTNLPGDDILNANARLSIANQGWTMALYGENLTNEDGAVSARTVAATATGSESYANRLRPRTFGLEVGYAFGR
jgi:outer membrane receptor protein involved in Fe transport